MSILHFFYFNVYNQPVPLMAFMISHFGMFGMWRKDFRTVFLKSKHYHLFNEQRSIALGVLTVCDMLKSYLGHWMSLLNLWPLFLKLVPRSLERVSPHCSPGQHGELLPAHAEKCKGKCTAVCQIFVAGCCLFVAHIAFQVVPCVSHAFPLRL